MLVMLNVDALPLLVINTDRGNLDSWIFKKDAFNTAWLTMVVTT